MSWHRRALADTPHEPWRNGAGTTRTLLAWPAAPHWQVRVAVAQIERDGPFSAYPGIARAFAVLEGAGVRLALPNGVRALSPDDDPLSFDGEAAPDCALLEGPTLDLNLMAERSAGRPSIVRAAAGSRLDGGARWAALYAHAPALVDLDGHRERLPAGTLLWTADARALDASVHEATQAYWLRLDDD